MQLPLITAVVIAVLSALFGALAFSRRRSWRGLLRGIGVAAFAIGSWFFGLMELLVNGCQELVSWILRISWSQQTINAAITMAGGIVLFVVAGFLSPGQQTGDTAQKANPGKVAKPGNKAVQPPTRPTQQTGLDSQDAEIEALLKARGIE